MPLKPGKSNDVVSENIEELMHSYEKDGKIGNTTPRDEKHALKIAKAIAMNKAGKSKHKDKKFKNFMESVLDKNNKIEANLLTVLKSGFNSCFESMLDDTGDDELNLQSALEFSKTIKGPEWSPLSSFVSNEGLMDEKHRKLTLTQIDEMLVNNDDPVLEDELFDLREFIKVAETLEEKASDHFDDDHLA